MKKRKFFFLPPFLFFLLYTHARPSLMCLLHAIHPICHFLKWFTSGAVTIPRILWALLLLFIHIYATSVRTNYLVGLLIAGFPILVTYLVCASCQRFCKRAFIRAYVWLLKEEASTTERQQQ